MFKLTNYVALDTETTGLDTEHDRPFCASLCNTEGQTLFVDLQDSDDPGRYTIRRLLRNEEGAIPVFHNAKFDLKMLRNVGFEYTRYLKYEDTILLSFRINEYHQSHSLDYLCQRYLRSGKYADERILEWKKRNKEDLKKNGYLNVPKDIIEPYAIHDAVQTLKLYYCFRGMTQKDTELLEQYEFDKRFLQDVIETERTGIYIDIKRGWKELEYWIEREKELEERLAASGIDNPRSPNQVLKALQKEFSWVSTTAKDMLFILQSKGSVIASDILEYRRVSNLLSKVLFPIMQGVDKKTNRIHTNFNLVKAKTGRLSSDHPNFQNMHRPDPSIPTSMIPRKLFVASPGFALEGFDYDQMEMRIIADECEESSLKDMYEKGEDVYVFIARWIWPGQEITKRMRYIAKQSTLGRAYGMGVSTFVHQCANYGVSIDHDEAQICLRKISDRFPAIQEKLRYFQRRIENTGYCSDRYGVRYHVPKDFAYKGLNAVIQGTAAGVCKRAWRALLTYCGSDLRLLNSIHDEFLLERRIENFPKEDCHTLIKTCMESQNFRFSVPLTASPKNYGNSWGDLN